MRFFRPRVEKLLEALEEKDDSQPPMERMARYREVKEKLSAIGARNPREVIPYLTTENADILGQCLSGSGETGAEALREVILRGERPLMDAALRALWEFEAAAAAEVPFLIQLLSHPDTEIRACAAHCLGRIGPDAREAGPELARLAQEGSEDEKRSAFYALTKCDYDPLILAEIGFDALRYEPPDQWPPIFDALYATGCDLGRAFPEILRVLGDPDLFKKHYFVGPKILERLDVTGEQRRQLIATVEKLVRDNESRIVELCAALLRLDPSSRCVRERIETDLRNGDSDMEAACDVICKLCEIGESGADFVPILIQQLRACQDYWDFCWAGVDALNRIGPAAADALPLLREMLAHPSPLVRRRTEGAIASIEGHPIPDEEGDDEENEG